MRRYKIPGEVSTELKINKWLYLTDLIIIVGLITLRTVTIDFVHSSLHWLFTTFLVIVGIIVIIRPQSNPQKRLYEALIYTIVRRKDTYTAINYDEGAIKAWRREKMMK